MAIRKGGKKKKKSPTTGARKTLDPYPIWAARWETRLREKERRGKEVGGPWYAASSVDADLLCRILRHTDQHFERRGAGLKIADAAMVYLDRTSVPLTEHTTRRLVIAASLLALKVDDDECLSNASWAACVGLTLKDMNRLEREFCESVDWALWLHPPPRHSICV